jgi:hypothetical protein
MSASKAAIPWLVWMAAFAPPKVAATEAPSAAPFVGADAPKSKGQWPPSLRDPTAPLIRSQPVTIAAPNFKAVQWLPRAYGFHHPAWERFCEALSASQLPAAPAGSNPFRRQSVLRALGKCLSRR